MPTFYCNFSLLGTRGPLTLGGPLDFANPAYPIVTPLDWATRRDATRAARAIYDRVTVGVTVAAVSSAHTD